jgi:hypothetical protein
LPSSGFGSTSVSPKMACTMLKANLLGSGSRFLL